MRSKRKGFFCVLEGIACTGKDKQAGLLVARAADAGLRFGADVEPTSGPFGQVVRALIENLSNAPFYEAIGLAGTLLAKRPDTRIRVDSILKKMQSGEPVSVLERQIIFMMDRLWHSLGSLGPRPEAGDIIVCVRYELSTFAFGTSHGIELADLLAWQNRILGSHYVKPDLTIYIRLSPETAAERLEKDGKVKDIFETETGRKTAAAYDKVIDFGREHGLFGKIVEINGEASVKKVHASILAELRKNSDRFRNL